MRARIVTGESAGTHCFAPLIPVHRDIRCPYPQSRGPLQGDGQSHRQGGTSTREMGQDSKHAASKQRADPREGKDISRQGVRDARAPIQLAIDRLDQAAQHRSRYHCAHSPVCAICWCSTPCWSSPPSTWWPSSTTASTAPYCALVVSLCLSRSKPCVMSQVECTSRSTPNISPCLYFALPQERGNRYLHRPKP